MRFTAIFLLLLAICCGVSSVVAAAEAMPKDDKAVKAEIGNDGIQHADIVGGGYFFSPDHIIVRVNVPVELKVRKEPGIVPHNIVMDSPEAGVQFDQSIHEEPQIIRFTPTRTGSYPFFCDKKLLFFESHREKGMEGTLEVVE